MSSVLFPIRPVRLGALPLRAFTTAITNWNFETSLHKEMGHE